MTTQMIDPPRREARSLSKPLLLWGSFCLMLAFYSMLVWEAGYHLLPQNYDPVDQQLIDEVEAAGNQGVPYSEISDKALEAYPLWNNLTAIVTGTYFGFGSNGNSDPVRYYNAADRGHGYVLAAGAAILAPTFNGFIGMMTSRETQSRLIS